MRKGRIPIAHELLLDLLCFDQKTHRVLAVYSDKRTAHVIVEGPEMPDVPFHLPAPEVVPTYRRKDWERV